MSETEGSACLLYLLNRLIVALEPTPIADPGLDAGREVVPQRWEDREYLYVEANLPGAAESDIDINIHGDRVFIRIER